MKRNETTMSQSAVSGTAEPDRPASSVGDILETHQVYSTSHPAYRNFSDAVTAQLNELAEREAVRLSSAKPLLLPYSLTSDQRAALAELYTEFAVTALPMSLPVHTYWNATRAAANEWVAVNARKYGRTNVHFGGSLLSSMVAGRADVHVETTLSDEVAVHEYYGERVAITRAYEEAGAIAKENRFVLPRSEYESYLAGRSYGLCTQPDRCTHQSETMCVDLSAINVSPHQVAIAMAQHGAEVCLGFFIYDPSMLVQDKGEFGDTGVWFDRTEDTVYFRYVEGRSGVSSYSRVTWSRWCSSHSFAIDAERKEWYQLELLKHRGHFMFFRLVKIPTLAQSMKVSHALELSRPDEYVLVKSWRLKHGFRSDASKGESWVPNHFLMRARVASRAYNFAMQLTAANFGRHQIKKQVRVVNNRWVVQGSVVSVAPALDPQQIEDFTTAVFVRAFVDRYESSRLSSEMMSALSSMAGFSDTTSARRLVIVGGAVLNWLYMRSFAKLDSLVRSVADVVRAYLKNEGKSARMVSWTRAPEYVLLTTANNRWHNVFQQHAEKFYALTDAELGIRVDPGGPGGFMAGVARTFARRSHRRYLSMQGEAAASDLHSVVRVVTDVLDTSLGGDDAVHSQFVSGVRGLNEVDQAGSQRHLMEFELAEHAAGEVVQAFRQGKGTDPVFFLNQLYAELMPGMARAEVAYDTFSLSLDPQDRTLAAPYLRMPSYFGLPPTPREYYFGNLKALSVPKRQNTAQELLTAIAARNLSAPAIAVPQDDLVVIKDVWENFLCTACVPGAKAKLLRYQSDPVALEDGALRDWAVKAKPDVVERLVKEMQEHSRALGEMSVKEYLVMIKADVKPTMSDKPLREVTAPQVIVYHDKLLSALYSSMIRVLVRRFMSLLKPTFYVNLLKDTKDISRFLTAVHDFEAGSTQFLENDFSKYDKSQSEFAFMLEDYIFRQLGLNQDMLDAWQVGHAECSLRSVTLGLSLHVMYQRKSGDATTAFGNVVLNIVSVLYAYQGTQVMWAVFMGDDSIVAASKVGAKEEAVSVLAEVFNLTAKFYITDAPYFASNFIEIDKARKEVVLIPDVVKRIERLSMAISAADPQWHERWVSFQDSMQAYTDPGLCAALARRVPLRYEVGEGLVSGAADALGALARDERAFRQLWEEKPRVLEA